MPPYDYDKTQLRAVVQGVYETLLKQRLGLPASRAFGKGSRRLDVRAVRAGRLSQEDIAELMGRAFAIAVAQGQKHGSIVPGTLKPTRQGVRRAYARLSRGWSDADYEQSLALARKPRAHVNPLPLAVAGKAAFWSVSIGMLAWEGYKMFRKKNPRTKQIARAGEGSALAVRGLRPVDPQTLRGAFGLVPWDQDPQGFGYVIYTADRTFPREDKVLREAGLHLDRSLQKQFRKRDEGEVEYEAARAAEALAEMDPVALARSVGPRSEQISRRDAGRDPLLGWLRSEDATAFFRAYPPRVTGSGDLDLPEEYGAEIARAVRRFAKDHNYASAEKPSQARIYTTLKRVFGIRKVGAYEVERTGIRVYRTAPNPRLSDAVARVASRLRSLLGSDDSDVAQRMLELLARAARVGYPDSPYAEPWPEDPQVSMQAAAIRRAAEALAVAELAKSGDARAFRAFKLTPADGVARVQERASVVVASAYEDLMERHQARAAREAWLLREIQAEAQRLYVQMQVPMRRNGVAAVALRAGALGARAAGRQSSKAVRAVQKWLRTERGRTFTSHALGAASAVGLQVLVEQASQHLTPKQAEVLAKAVSRETGVQVSGADVVTALGRT